MAKTGDSLTAPEAGWRRYDDADSAIKRIGTWVNDPLTGAYQGAVKYTIDPNGKIEFFFTGTQLRVMANTYPNKPVNMPISIDGVTETYSINSPSPGGQQILVYEKKNLENKLHFVRIESPSNLGSQNWNIDSIDIDSNGEIRSPYNKFLISTGAEKSYSMQVADTTKNVARESGVLVTASNTAGGSPSALVDGTIIPNSWYASPNKNVWVAIEFPNSKEIFRYTMATAAGGYGVMPSPKDWALQGSNDDFATFDTLDTRTEIRGWVDSVKKVFDVPKDKVRAYKKYRIYVFQSGHAVEVTHINEIEMFEDYVKIIDLGNKTLNEADYISKGLNKGFVVDINREITKRVGIESTSSTLGSGKVFKKTVDTTGIPIKNVSIT